MACLSSLLRENVTRRDVAGFAGISSIPSRPLRPVPRHLMQHTNNLYIWPRLRLPITAIPISTAKNEKFEE